MVLTIPPARELAALVQAYWFIQDLPGEHEGRLIATSPVPLAVLSVNFGRPNAAENGDLVPGVSLLGLQSRARSWRSWSETYFVMAMLTISGLVRLFPHAGSDSADMLLDLGAITGDGPAQNLKGSFGVDQEPLAIASRLDKWLIARLARTPPVGEAAQIRVAHSVLRRGGTVEAAAEMAQVNRRQLHRLFRRHLGAGPEKLSDLERLQSSLKSVQTGLGDPMDGFSDQAHQIRRWRHRLGVTPGAYVRAVRTPLASHASENGKRAGLAYYL
jgi:AraC-like DNA-binding protein